MTTGDREREPDSRSWPTPPAPAPAPGILGDVRAEWIGFYDDHYHRVVRFVMHNGASRPEAEDAAQEAFAESWKLMDRESGRQWRAVANKGAWVRTVALLRHKRPPGPRKRPLMVPSADVPDFAAPGPGHSELTAQSLTVLQALRTLDGVDRAVMAFDMDDFTTADIAAALRISEQRVRDVKKKARIALKRHLVATAAAEGAATTPEGRQP
ncbi:MAG: sigma-70 family RNA polymerase sigma factor [Nocardiopsaceae bacterium]|nr:sigma-70 family RNA polymerase sigma factor [Nocardiopsaceae bacterium]